MRNATLRNFHIPDGKKKFCGSNLWMYGYNTCRMNNVRIVTICFSSVLWTTSMIERNRFSYNKRVTTQSDIRSYSCFINRPFSLARFEIMWRTKLACPICTAFDYTKVKSSCEVSLYILVYVPLTALGLVIL